MADALGINLAGASDDEIRAAKREHAIRQREKDFAAKREEEEERKRDELEQARRDLEEKEELERQRTMQFLAARAKARHDKKVKEEKLNSKRDVNIQKREAKWVEKANKAIFDLKEEHEDYLNRVEENMGDARKSKQAKKDATRQTYLDLKTYREDLDVQREDKEVERTTLRLVKELSRVDEVKSACEDELRSFLNNPAPVPLKQVLAGRLRPVPTVTTLLAAHKDQTEELKELEHADLPMRALLRKQTLFTYIREIKEKAESARIKPPEPVVGDMGRGSRSKSPRKGGASPKNTTGQFRKSSPTRGGSPNRSMRSTR
jgi:hypothetical protein